MRFSTPKVPSVTMDDVKEALEVMRSQADDPALDLIKFMQKAREVIELPKPRRKPPL